MTYTAGAFLVFLGLCWGWVLAHFVRDRLEAMGFRKNRWRLEAEELAIELERVRRGIRT